MKTLEEPPKVTDDHQPKERVGQDFASDRDEPRLDLFACSVDNLTCQEQEELWTRYGKIWVLFSPPLFTSQKMPSLKTRPCRRRGDCLCGVTEIRAAKSLFYRLKVIERGNSSVLANAESEFEMRVKRKRKSCSSLHQKLYKNLNLLLFLFSS